MFQCCLSNLMKTILEMLPKTPPAYWGLVSFIVSPNGCQNASRSFYSRGLANCVSLRVCNEPALAGFPQSEKKNSIYSHNTAVGISFLRFSSSNLEQPLQHGKSHHRK